MIPLIFYDTSATIMAVQALSGSVCQKHARKDHEKR
jgi:hypothetical protein